MIAKLPPFFQTRSPPPESPTTVAQFDMDDDDVQESATGTGVPASNKTADEVPPPKPPRPLSPQQQAENTLKEAFPSIDAAVVKAVLIASGGRVEPAFNALLGKLPTLSHNVTFLIFVLNRHVRPRCRRRSSSSSTPQATSATNRFYSTITDGSR